MSTEKRNKKRKTINIQRKICVPFQNSASLFVQLDKLKVFPPYALTFSPPAGILDLKKAPGTSGAEIHPEAKVPGKGIFQRKRLR